MIPRLIVSWRTTRLGFPWRASSSGAFQSQYEDMAMSADEEPAEDEEDAADLPVHSAASFTWFETIRRSASTMKFATIDDPP